VSFTTSKSKEKRREKWKKGKESRRNWENISVEIQKFFFCVEKEISHKNPGVAEEKKVIFHRSR
jgi:hypothetical protein